MIRINWIVQTVIVFPKLLMSIGGLASIQAQNEAHLVGVEWSNTGLFIATSDTNGTIQIRNSADNIIVTSLTGHQGLVTDMEWNASDTQLASSGPDKVIRIWDISTGSLVQELSGFSDTVLSVGWSPDGNRIIGSSGPDFPKTFVFDVATGNIVQDLPIGSVLSMETSSDSTHIALGTVGYVAIMDWVSLTTVTVLNVADLFTGRGVTKIAWHPNGKLVAGGSIDGLVQVWEISTGDIVHQLASNNHKLNASDLIPISQVHALTFDETGDLLYSFNGEGIVRIWDWQAGQLLQEQTYPTPVYGADWHDALLTYVSSSPEPVTSNTSFINQFTLTNADTNTEIRPLSDNDTINLSVLGTSNLTIRASSAPKTVGSVVFYLNSTPAVQTDDTAPYDLTNWIPTPGQYTLTTTPYSGAGGTGISGIPLTINLTVIGSSAACNTAPKPALMETVVERSEAG